MNRTTRTNLAYLQATHIPRPPLEVDFNRRVEAPSDALAAANAKISEAHKPSYRERRERRRANAGGDL